MRDKKKSYKDLIIWQKADQLFHMVADDVNNWPNVRVAKAISYQVLSSAGSISTNIAEGYGRGGSKEFRQYFRQS
ncbi:four helix bundle protein [Candidatus Microgenomates bacterium]|nr:four helix bundle protein [Candidatus Microgenomates bacterium]